MNANELQKELAELYQGLKSGAIKPPVACEMNNTAGKMTSLAKLQFDYMRFCKETPSDANRIGLLESTTV